MVQIAGKGYRTGTADLDKKPPAAKCSRIHSEVKLKYAHAKTMYRTQRGKLNCPY